MPTTPIITLAQLEISTNRGLGSLAEDAFAAFVVEQASAVVSDTARHPDWETGETAPPREAVRIALTIATRAYSNPELETSYGIGPISGRSRDEWAYGFEPTPYELDQLEGLRGGGTGGGLWVQPIGDGLTELNSVYLNDPWGTPILYQNEGDVGTDPLVP